MRANRDAFGQILTGLCADCDAELQLVEIAPGVTSALILHDDTCPTLRAMEGT